MEKAALLIALEVEAPSHPALEYGLRLAELLRWPVTFLCVGKPAQNPALGMVLDEAQEHLGSLGLTQNLVWDVPPLVEAILRHRTRAEDTLLVFSDIHRPRWRRWVHGGRFRRLLAEWPGPLLRIRQVPWPPQKLLVCSGGLDYTTPLETWMLNLARLSGAALTVLHVVEPATLDYPLAEAARRHWSHWLETDTPQAHHLKALLNQAQEAGIACNLRLRHGSVVREIIAEIGAGGYDLVGMGSPYSAHSLRRVFRPEVTSLVAAAMDKPLLTLRRLPDP